jgi:CubicO group peptidase (beta-lactamase class C family)
MFEFPIQQSENNEDQVFEKKILKAKEFMYQNIGPGINLSIKSNTNWNSTSTGEIDNDRGPTSPNILYDIASITKFVTALQLLELVSEGEVDLNDKIGKYLPFLSHIDTTLEEMLSHKGMFDIVEKYDTSRQYLPSDLERLFANSDNVRLLTPEKYNYGDIGYMYLGNVLSLVRSQGLDEATSDFVTRNGLGSIMYNPAAKGVDLDQIARSETEILPGIVQDEKARWYSGVSGHAGLFADLNSLQTLVDKLLAKEIPISEELYSRIFVPEYEPSPTTGMQFTIAGLRIGLHSKHPNTSGYVGSTIIIDPEKSRAIVHTSNVTFPHRNIDRSKYRKWNKSLGDF